MLKSYIKTTLRVIRRSPLSSFINIFGLAMAIGCSIMVYTFVDYDLTTDQYHENKDNIFLSTMKIDRNGRVMRFGITPIAYGEQLLTDFPQIDRMVRLESRSGVVKSGAHVFNERISFTDDGFFDMFSFPLKWGNKDALSDPSKIIISENVSIKYFGQENPIGETMTFDFGNDTRKSYEIAGVAQKFNYKASLRFNILTNFENIQTADLNFDVADWSNFLDATFLQLKNPENIHTIAGQLDKYVPIQNEVQKDWPAQSFGFEPWTTLYLNGEDINNNINGDSDPLARMVLTIIGIFIMTLAIFNYINIAIVSATKRLKEIGVRKVMGGKRKSLIFQFLAENVILTLFALVIGFITAITFFVPGFDALFTIGLEFPYQDPRLWMFLAVLVIFVGLASGAYPAIYISSFNAVNIFRGSLRFGKKNPMTKIFLTIQFILSCITVAGGIMFTQNSNYQKERDWGYTQEQVLVAQAPDAVTFERLKNVMVQDPNVIMHSGSQGHLTRGMNSRIIELLDRKVEVRSMDIDHNYITTLGIRMKSGRDFEENRETDKTRVIVNEMMAKILDPNDALDKTFKLDSIEYTVIGVVQNYHHWSFNNDIEPTFLRLVDDKNQRYLSLKVREGSAAQTFEKLEAEWAGILPQTPFNGFFQDQRFDNYFEEIKGHGKILSAVAILAVILSCLGLYGLVSLNLTSRIKEFSIRKVLGAQFGNIVKVINKQFMLFLIIALIIGGPVSFYLMKSLMDEIYSFYMPLTAAPIMLTFGVVIFMVVITISSQVRKVVKANPTDGLRSQ